MVCIEPRQAPAADLATSALYIATHVRKSRIFNRIFLCVWARMEYVAIWNLSTGMVVPKKYANHLTMLSGNTMLQGNTLKKLFCMFGEIIQCVPRREGGESRRNDKQKQKTHKDRLEKEEEP